MRRKCQLVGGDRWLAPVSSVPVIHVFPLSWLRDVWKGRPYTTFSAKGCTVKGCTRAPSSLRVCSHATFSAKGCARAPSSFKGVLARRVVRERVRSCAVIIQRVCSHATFAVKGCTRAPSSFKGCARVVVVVVVRFEVCWASTHPS